MWERGGGGEKGERGRRGGGGEERGGGRALHPWQLAAFSSRVGWWLHDLQGGRGGRCIQNDWIGDWDPFNSKYIYHLEFIWLSEENIVWFHSLGRLEGIKKQVEVLEGINGAE